MADNDIKIRLLVQTAGGKKEIREFNTSLDGLGNSANRASKKTTGSFKRIFSSAKKFIGVAGVAGIVYGAGRLVQASFSRMMERGKEFESALAELSSITGIVGSDLDALGKNALDTSVEYGVAGADIIEANKLVASQLAEKIDFGTSEGMRELQEVSRQAVVLAKASGVTLSTAVETTTTVLNQFNLEASETSRIIDSIAAGAKYGAAEAQEQSNAYREAGSVFAAANRDFEELNASTQILAANAISGSRAGTGLRNMMTILQSEAEKLAKHGITDVNVKTDTWSQTLTKLEPLLGDTAAMAQIFGRENLTVAQILIQNAASVEQMNQKVRESGIANDQAKTRLNTYQGALDKLSAAIDSKLIPAFERSNGVMVKSIDIMTTMVLKMGDMFDELNRMADPTGKLKEEMAGLGEVIKSNGGLSDEMRQSLEKSTSALIQQFVEMKAREKELTPSRRGRLITKELGDLRRALPFIEARILSYSEILDTASTKSDEASLSIGKLTTSFLTQLRAFEGAESTPEELDPFAKISDTLPDYNLDAAISAQEETARRESELHDERMGRIDDEKLATINAENAKQKEQIESQKSYKDLTATILTSAAMRRGSAADTANAVIDAMFAEIVAIAIKSAMESIPFPFNIAAAGLAAGAASGLRSLLPEFADGGLIRGPGSSRSDSVPLMGSRDEYMVNAKSTKALGVSRMDRINRSPSFARSVARMIDGMPHLNQSSPMDLSGIESAVRHSNGSAPGGNSDIIRAINDQTQKMAQMESKVNFVFSTFSENDLTFRQQEQIQGR